MQNFRVSLSLFIGILLVTALPLNSQNALDLDGTNDVVTSNYTGILGNGARTVEAWIKTTANANPSASGVQQIITDWGSFVTGGRFTFCILWGNAIRIEVGGNGLSGTIAVNDGNWHHVAGVYDPTATNQVSLYVDGVLDVAGNLTVATNTVAGTGVQIGLRVDNSRRFDGSIDDVRVWSVARAQADIAANRNNEICTMTPGLEVYYNCNAGTAGGTNTVVTTLRDYSGNGRDGTLANFALAGSSSNWVTGVNITPGITITETTAMACDSFYWPADSTFYTMPGSYMAMLSSGGGCDSIINLDLSINASSSSTDSAVSCQSYFWSVSGSTYVQSGTYTQTLMNAVGCDSVISLDLTINPSDTVDETVTQCVSYYWPADSTTYTQSGNYSALLTNANGCDSLVRLALTIQPVDTSVTNNGLNGLSANLAGGSYQWLACDNGFFAIPGATMQSFLPSQNGSFAVVVTSGACSDTSNCHTSIVVGNAPPLSAEKISLFPNPGRGRFAILLGQVHAQVSVRVFDPMGKVVFGEDFRDARRVEMQPELADGVYFVEVRTADGGLRVLRFWVGD